MFVAANASDAAPLASDLPPAFLPVVQVEPAELGVLAVMTNQLTVPGKAEVIRRCFETKRAAASGIDVLVRSLPFPSTTLISLMCREQQASPLIIHVW